MWTVTQGRGNGLVLVKRAKNLASVKVLDF